MGAFLTKAALDVATNTTFPTLWYDDGSGILKQVVQSSLNLPSGIDPVTGQFTANGNSVPFGPIAGRGFNVCITDNFAGVISVTRSFDNGIHYLATGQTFVAGVASLVIQEPEAGVLYRLECAHLTSGTPHYRMSQ